MIIKKLEIISFGKFSNKVIEFSDGLNIILGNNESGKSTVINCLYDITSMQSKFECNIELEDKKGTHKLIYFWKKLGGSTNIWVKDDEDFATIPGNPDFKQKYPFSAIFPMSF